MRPTLQSHKSVTLSVTVCTSMPNRSPCNNIYENKLKIKGNVIIRFEVVIIGQLHVPDFHSEPLKSHCLPCIWPNSSRFSAFITTKCFCLHFRPFVLCLFVLRDDHFSCDFTSANYPVVPDMLISLVPNHTSVNVCSELA